MSCLECHYESGQADLQMDRQTQLPTNLTHALRLNIQEIHKNYTSSTLVEELQISTSSSVGNGCDLSSMNSARTVLRTLPEIVLTQR